MPLSDLPSSDPVRLAITAQVNPELDLAAGATVQGVELAEGDLLLLLGMTSPIDNGFYKVFDDGASHQTWPNTFSGSITPGHNGHYAQFKVAVTAGTNAGKTYFLATPVPALFEHGLEFLELTDQTPTTRGGPFSNTAPAAAPLPAAIQTKTYVCKVARNTNAALPMNPGPKTLDGVDLVNGDYYLLKGQTELTEDGVFIVAAGGDAKAQATGVVRARITAGTNAGKDYLVNQSTGVVTSTAPGQHA